MTEKTGILKPPISPCSYGCLPCNIYCFKEVVEATNRLKEEINETQIKGNVVEVSGLLRVCELGKGAV